MAEAIPSPARNVQPITFGKPSRGSKAAESIYDCFTWDTNPIEVGKQVQDHSYNQGLDQSVKASGNNNKFDGQADATHGKLDPEKEYQLSKGGRLNPHQIKSQLYQYQTYHLKKSHSQAVKAKAKTEREVIATKPQKKSTKPLDENDEHDRKLIQARQKKIKQFRQYTRDLPNSAFTTYYGRPAFEAYGRCNSASNLRTHNVMPHRGENHPATGQTYEGALLYGKRYSVHNNLPRKPLENQKPAVGGQGQKGGQIMHLPLQKPDLINHVRFAEPKQASDRKDPVPRHEDVNYLPKRQYKSKSKAKKKQPRQASLTEFDDGLKFMNTRDHLLSLIEEKKMKESRLAYKVTECYPCQDVGASRASDASGARPAGLPYERGLTADKVIHRRY